MATDSVVKTGNRLHLPIVIEDQGGDEGGVDWIVSFSGIHPEEAECVSVKDGPTAFKLVGLIKALVTAAHTGYSL